MKTLHCTLPSEISLLCTASLLIGLFAPVHLTSQTERNTLFEQLTYTDVLKVEIQTDIDSLFDGNRFENEYQDANFIYKNKDGEEEIFDMKLRLRGRFRRKNCVIPPIKLNFDKDDLKARGWKKDDEIKLVTPCIDSPEGRDYIMREYIAYKIYQIMNPLHFRVQLIKLTLTDPNGKNRFKGWGILVEDDETLAKRWDMEICDECYSINIDHFDQESLASTAIFQYLIGNSDWSVTLNKNVEILYKINDSGDTTYHTVPYDFDFSGIVNPTYATPNSDYGLTSVRERIFICPLDQEGADNGVKLLLEKKQSIIQLVKDFKPLNFESRNDVIEYIESCFSTMANEGLKRPNRLIGN